MVHTSKPAIAQEDTMLMSAEEVREHSIKDFLGRPVPIVTVAWATTDNPNDVLPGTALHFPTVIWNTNMWAEKLKGFRFLKADLNFQVQVNGSPFDVGRLFAFWSPFDQERDDLRPFKSRTNVTGYPGLEIDVGNKMTGTLTIPYASMYSHIDQVKGSQPYGTFRLYVISQFFSQNDPNIDVTVYCWLTNVHVATPTTVTTLGFDIEDWMVNPFYGKDIVKQEVNSFSEIPFRSQSESESRSARGIVTGGARLVGQAARMFANVPVVGEVAKPLAWMSDVVGGAATLMGFSKPVSVASNTVFQNVPAKGFTHSDGLDQSVMLGSKPDIEIKDSFKVFGTDEDEMNLSRVISKPNWIEAFNWKMTDDPKLSYLYMLPLTAGICGTETNAAFSGNYFFPTHMAMVASAFRYWRGSISVRLTAVKNQYYSGRLVIVYYPGRRPTDIIDYTTGDVNMCPKWIWDVKEDAEIQLTFEFNSNAQWLRTKLFNNKDPAQVAVLTTDTIIGFFAVYVDNKLRAPATVPDNIWIHVYVHGGSDMRFAVPDMVRYGNYNAVPAAALLPLAPTLTNEQYEFLLELYHSKNPKVDTDKIKQYLVKHNRSLDRLNKNRFAKQITGYDKFRPQCGDCDEACSSNDLIYITSYVCAGQRYFLFKSRGNGQIKIIKIDSIAGSALDKAPGGSKPFRPQMYRPDKKEKVELDNLKRLTSCVNKELIVSDVNFHRGFLFVELDFSDHEKGLIYTPNVHLELFLAMCKFPIQVELLKGAISLLDQSTWLMETGFSKSKQEKEFRSQMLKVESTFDINGRNTSGVANPEGSSLLDMPKENNLNPEMYCIGEVINNLRPLTRRFSLDFAWASTGVVPPFTLDPAWFFDPSPVSVRTPINYFSRMYVFYRGSVRYKIFVTRDNTRQVSSSAIPRVIITSSEIISTSPRSYITVPDAPSSASGGRFTQVQYNELNPIVEVTCPFYSNVPIQLVSRTYITDLHLRMIYKLSTTADVATTNNNGSIWKAAGDDFSYGYLVGCPPLLDYGEL